MEQGICFLEQGTIGPDVVSALWPSLMAKHDFSHLFDQPYVLADTISKGFKVTDESWLSTAERIEPTLLGKSGMEDLRWVLDHMIERRGGKPIQSVSQGLIEQLEIIDRADLPKVFLDGLIERLRSGKKYTRRDSDRAYSKRYRREDRDRIVVFLYDYIYNELVDDPKEVSHDIFGTFSVPRGSASRSEKTLAILDDLLTTSSVYDPPAQSTLFKIVSEARDRKRRPRT